MSEHKKANNVFILVSDEKGMFENGNCYLSAETLTEMRAWIQDIRAVIFKEIPHEHNNQLGSKSPSHKALRQMNDLYNADGHLTYSYSEDEEDEMYSSALSQRSIPRSTSSSRSPSLTRSPLMSRSTDSSLRRRTLQRNFKSSQNYGTIRSGENSEHYQKLGQMLSDLSRQSECFDSTLKRLEKESEEQFKQPQVSEEGLKQSPVSREELKDKIESVNTIMLSLECETSQLLEVKHTTNSEF